jgi:hypothetical protein
MLRAVAVAAVIGGTASAVFLAARKFDDRRAGSDIVYTYWDQLLHPVTSDKSLIARIPDGCFIQLFDWQRCVVPGMFKSRSHTGHVLNYNLPIGLVVGFVVIVGWLTLVRTRGDVWTWTFPCFMALNVAWAADVGTRYTLPIMPVVLVSFSLGLTRLLPGSTRLFVPYFAAHAIVGMGLWLAVELPRTSALNQSWSDADVLCARIDRDRDSVRHDGLSPEQLQLFRFDLDRDVPRYAVSTDGSKPHSVWVVSRDGYQPLPGYESVAASGPYRLWRRVGDGP